MLDAALADDPAREALVTRSRRLSYAELDREADRAAHALRDLGVAHRRPGGAPRCPTTPTWWWPSTAPCGSGRCGSASTGRWPRPEKRFLLEDSGATLLLLPTTTGPTSASGSSTWRGGGRPWRRRPTGPIGVDVDPLAPAGIAYTSGTTGRPKGAVHSQHGLLTPGRGAGGDPRVRRRRCARATASRSPILNLAVLTTLLVSQAGGTLDRDGPHRRRGRRRVDPGRADHHLERPARAAPQPGHDGRGGRRGPGLAHRGVDRRRRLPRGHPGGLRGQVRPARAGHLRAERGAHRRGDRPAGRTPRRRRPAAGRCRTWPCASPAADGAIGAGRGDRARCAWRRPPATTATG